MTSYVVYIINTDNGHYRSVKFKGPFAGWRARRYAAPFIKLSTIYGVAVKPTFA